MKTTKFTVKGTHCIACKNLIEEICREIDGIASCNVDFKTGMTIIEHNEKLNLGIVKKEIESLGIYKVQSL